MFFLTRGLSSNPVFTLQGASVIRLGMIETFFVRRDPKNLSWKQYFC